jgi:cytochrome c oxidase assembly protein subunit 15
VILLVSAIQTVTGTQVRELIDQVAIAAGEANRSSWLSHTGDVFLFHRSFSTVTVILTVALAVRARKSFERGSLIYRGAMGLLLLVAAQIASGKVLDNLGFPAAVQSIHLFIGSLIAGLQIFISILIFTKVKPAPAAA